MLIDHPSASHIGVIEEIIAQRLDKRRIAGFIRGSGKPGVSSLSTISDPFSRLVLPLIRDRLSDDIDNTPISVRPVLHAASTFNHINAINGLKGNGENV